MKGIGAIVKFNQPVQGVDLSLNAPAVGNIDHRKPGCVHDVPGHHDVGLAEQDETVGIAVRGGLVQNLDALVVHAKGVARCQERLGGPGVTGIDGLALRALILRRTLSCARIAAAPVVAVDATLRKSFRIWQASRCRPRNPRPRRNR